MKKSEAGKLLASRMHNDMIAADRYEHPDEEYREEYEALAAFGYQQAKEALKKLSL